MDWNKQNPAHWFCFQQKRTEVIDRHFDLFLNSAESEMRRFLCFSKLHHSDGYLRYSEILEYRSKHKRRFCVFTHLQQYCINVSWTVQNVKPDICLKLCSRALVEDRGGEQTDYYVPFELSICCLIRTVVKDLSDIIRALWWTVWVRQLRAEWWPTHRGEIEG